jgi:hypothetical protein
VGRARRRRGRLRAGIGAGGGESRQSRASSSRCGPSAAATTSSSAAAIRLRPSRRGRGRSGRREVAQQRRLDDGVERLAVHDSHDDPVPRTRLTQRATRPSRGAEQTAGEHAAAEGQAAAQKIGLQPDQRAADDAAPERRLPFVEAQPHLVVGGQPGQDLSLGAAFEADAGGSAPGCRRAPRRRARRASVSCACRDPACLAAPRPSRRTGAAQPGAQAAGLGSGTGGKCDLARPPAIVCIAVSNTPGRAAARPP